jgi:hypothetical protein
MKKNYPVLLLLLLLFGTQRLFAQFNKGTSLCQDVYVWDFKDQDNKSSKLLKAMADDVESALTQCTECVVLERRNFAKMSQQVTNEQEIEKISSEIKNAFGTKAAKVVVLGDLVNDEAAVDLELKLRFQSLINKQILLTKSIFLPRNIAFQNAMERKRLIQEFIFREILNIQVVPKVLPPKIENVPAQGTVIAWGVGSLVGVVGTGVSWIVASKTNGDWDTYWATNSYDTQKLYGSKNSQYKAQSTLAFVSATVAVGCGIAWFVTKGKRDNAINQQMPTPTRFSQIKPFPRFEKRTTVETEWLVGPQVGLVVHF